MNVREIRNLYDYAEWANGLVMDAAEKLAAEALLEDRGISHHSILGTLVHMAGAEWIWLERWCAGPPMGPAAWTQWTVEQCRTLAQLRGKWKAVVDRRHGYLAGLKDADLPQQISFKRLNGDTASLPLEQQLLHVVNHATLHRGQVVGMIRQLGVAPPSTDLLYYLLIQS